MFLRLRVLFKIFSDVHPRPFHKGGSPQGKMYAKQRVRRLKRYYFEIINVPLFNKETLIA